MSSAFRAIGRIVNIKHAFQLKRQILPAVQSDKRTPLITIRAKSPGLDTLYGFLWQGTSTLSF